MVEILKGTNTIFLWTVRYSRSTGRISPSVFQHSQDQERKKLLDPDECELSIRHSETSTFPESGMWRKLFLGIASREIQIGEGRI
jgi:hypothetical protein